MNAPRPLIDYPHPLIAREGWPFIGIALLLAVAVQDLCGLAAGFPFGVLFLFVLQFFRDPPRDVAGHGPTCVVAPADGRIVAVEETSDPYLERRAVKVSIFMNVFNVHSNRAPVDGVVERKWYNKGKFLNAALDKASLKNERCALHLKTGNGYDVTCVQVAGLIARRILNYAEAGTRYARGDRYGFIRFGSRVDLYLPPDARIAVSIDEKVYASSTLIAELPDAPEAQS
ncbi:MAG: phosphatidylserine decarboxylase [Zoogloeaceae bacterium]|jgi:phosphatidylserine decarboxylase|nr:phosphatidylserine decarboxylase [Zoogloeaceae bacterium]